jgi:hypothetical protein
MGLKKAQRGTGAEEKRSGENRIKGAEEERS